MCGKGSKRRPQLVSSETYCENWDRVFGASIDDETVTRLVKEGHACRREIERRTERMARLPGTVK
jgi:hypothetical protein